MNSFICLKVKLLFYSFLYFLSHRTTKQPRAYISHNPPVSRRAAAAPRACGFKPVSNTERRGGKVCHWGTRLSPRWLGLVFCRVRKRQPPHTHITDLQGARPVWKKIPREKQMTDSSCCWQTSPVFGSQWRNGTVEQNSLLLRWCLILLFYFSSRGMRAAERRLSGIVKQRCGAWICGVSRWQHQPRTQTTTQVNIASSLPPSHLSSPPVLSERDDRRGDRAVTSCRCGDRRVRFCHIYNTYPRFHLRLVDPSSFYATACGTCGAVKGQINVGRWGHRFWRAAPKRTR